MANPYPTELRVRAVHAYEAGSEPCEQVAARFHVGVATLERWLRRQRLTGTVDPLAKAGGWTSPVDCGLLQRVVAERPDRTTEEVRREYNRRAAPVARVHRSSILRALQRLGYVFKKTIATGGTRSCAGPDRADGVPGLGCHRRPQPARVHR